MERIIVKVNSGEPLPYDEAELLFEGMVRGDLSDSQIASALIAIKLRRETVDELSALVATLDRHKQRLAIQREGTVDTCGTGGDGKSSVNVSTAVSVVLCSLGIPVVKHGNRAQSGAVGSADILAGLGFDLGYTGSSPEDFFSTHGYVFMSAPDYHPAMKRIAPVRRELKVPTVFNYAGPLINPADPEFQIIGINRRDRIDFIGRVLEKLGRRNVTVYSSRDGYDEVSPSGETECLHIGEGAPRRFTVDPSDYFTPFPMPAARDLREATRLFIDGLSGENELLGYLFALNTALALRSMNRCGIRDGFHIALEHINQGHPFRKLEELTGSIGSAVSLPGA
ncbi:MAG: anthranilate phosphoribosyltransferase [Spirochaetes bacterium]|nr:anthranilate phosphoribosyltransferase [Spirochaetota bacterium]